MIVFSSVTSKLRHRGVEKCLCTLIVKYHTKLDMTRFDKQNRITHLFYLEFLLLATIFNV